MSNPIGTITLWSGPIAPLPVGWLLCNGNGGTPDLRDKFILGAGGVHAVDEVGGSDEHNHPLDIDAHDHSALATHDCPGAGGISAATVDGAGKITDMTQTEGDADTVTLLPPFYTLAYIMRVA